MNFRKPALSISQLQIFKFWMPLAATWLMMSIEGPYISALIARLSEPKFNLAAYGIAFSLAMIVEAPIIMIMSAATALVKDHSSFKKLRKFNYTLIFFLTLTMVLLIFPPVFYFITEKLIGLPHQVSSLAHLAVTVLIPWPGAIGYRRFYQGILIRNNLTRRVAYGTIIRLLTMSVTALALFSFTKVPGVVVGAAALSAGVVCEAAASRVMVLKTLRRIRTEASASLLTQREIFSFYYPLALTSLLTIGIQPFVTFLIGQSRMPIESFAVLPVVTSFVFIFRALGLSYQEVVIALAGDSFELLPDLFRFAGRLALFAAGILMIIAFTPLSYIWLKNVSGLSVNLTEFARMPLMIMSFFPALTVLISVQRAVLVKAGSTRQITYGTAVEFFGIIITAALCIKSFDLVGAEAAVIAFVAGRMAACAYLIFPAAAAIKQKAVRLQQLNKELLSNDNPL